MTALSASVPSPSAARRSEGDGFVERAAGETQSRGADGDPEQVQCLHRDAEAFAGRADQLAANAVELEAREWVRGDHFDALGNGQAGRVSRDDEMLRPRAPSPSPVRAKTV